MPDNNIPQEILDDPFFFDVKNTEWNACIGSQSDAENYLDGYIAASIRLVEGLIENKAYGDRDTLILPILHCARHGIELSLKYAVQALLQMGVLAQAPAQNHNLIVPFTLLESSNLGDRELSRLIAELKPFVVALHQMDDTGEGLRYARKRGGEKSLADRTIINLRVVRFSLLEMSHRVERLNDRLDSLARERVTKAFTRDCSRQDLMEIAKHLPDRKLWTTPAFDQAKKTISEKFGIGGRQFSAAVEIIKSNRSMRAAFGHETPPGHLSEGQALRFLDEALKIREFYSKYTTDSLVISGEDIFEMLSNEDDAAFNKSQYEVINNEFSSDDLADIETIFYLGRNAEFAEFYEERLANAKKRFARAKDVGAEFYSVFSKTNLVESFIDGIARLGAQTLATTLSERAGTRR